MDLLLFLLPLILLLIPGLLVPPTLFLTQEELEDLLTLDLLLMTPLVVPLVVPMVVLPLP
jgi:hypothetical protein